MQKIILTSFSFFCLSSLAWSQQVDIHLLREQAVLQIRQGDSAQGLLTLAELQKKYPDDQLILADYLLSLKQLDQLDRSDLYLFQHIQKDFPAYAQISILRTLRDLKQFDVALHLAEQFEFTHQSTDLKVIKAILAAEAQKTEITSKTLKSLDNTSLNQQQLVNLAYAARKSGLTIKALEYAEKAYQDRNNKEAQAEYYYALSELEDYSKLLEILTRDQIKIKNPLLYHQLYQTYFAQKIRQGVNVRDYRMYWGASKPNADIDKTIAEMLTYAQDLDIHESNHQPFFFDLIYILSEQNRDNEAIAWVKQLNPETTATPNYARQAIAEVYLGLKQPKQAELWYKSLVTEGKTATFNAYSGLYYALIEQEKYADAGELLQMLDVKIETLQVSDAPGSQPEVHNDRANYINLLGLHEAYSNRLKQAEQYYQHLLTLAPNNSTYINQLSMIQRWRNKPEQAKKTLKTLTGIQPVSKSTTLNEMQNAQALGDINVWRKQLEKLQQIDATDTGVIKAARELRDRERFSISHSSTYGRSKANDQQMAKSLQGLNDRDSLTGLYFPWINDHYRLFSQYKTQWSEYREGEIQENRYGVGLEWAKDRKNLQAYLSQNDKGNRIGIQLNWSQWINDHWYYQLGYNSATDIPLQALLQGYSGESYQVGLTWQQDESRRVDSVYKFSKIDDGNNRQELMLGLTQDLFQSPHHQTEMNFSTYYGKNSLDNAAYFNPKDNYSVEVNFSHDWLTWRSYERSFNQHFEIGVGGYGQSGFEQKPMYSAQYLHEWKLSRDWQFNYGIGWKQHPYDGQQEQRTYGILGFEGRF